MNLLIKNVNAIDCSHNFYGDVYIENGIIKEVGNIENKHCKTINGEGLTLMPSFIDMHAHFREPGFTYKEDIESGSKAALRGGYTAVNLMANTNPICSTKEVLDYINHRVESVGLIDANQCISITKNFDGKTLEHLKEFNNNDIKAISDDGKGVDDARVMMEAMKISREKNWLLISHAESKEFSDIDMRLAENMMTWRDITLAKVSGCNLHMAHVSTREAMEYVIDGKRNDVTVTCEVTPHHIALHSGLSTYRVNPPIREKDDVEFLIKAIKQGYVDVIGTDHAPHSKEDKDKGSPGLVGIETAFPICYTKLVRERIINLSKLSEMMSSKPAELLKMNKGKICPGYDGDLVLIDLEKKNEINSKEFLSKSHNTPFEGIKVYGEIVKTIKAGRVVYSNIGGVENE